MAWSTRRKSFVTLEHTWKGLTHPNSNIIIPRSPSRWTEKIILAITHLANTGGIAVAMYGASPSRETGGLQNPSFAQIGNCMMLFVLFGVSYWIWPTYKRVRGMARHPNARPAMWLIRGAAMAIPFQLLRIAYSTLYAFNPITKWNAVSGTLAMRVIFMFLAQLGVAFAATAAGWMSRDVLQKKQLPEEDRPGPAFDHTPWRRSVRHDRYETQEHDQIPLEQYSTDSGGRKVESVMTSSHRRRSD